MTSRRISLLAAVAWLVAPAAPARAQGGGTISGTVTAQPAKYLQETVVYVKAVPGHYPPRSVMMDQRGLQFVPHVLAITVGDTVQFQNHDPVEHNVNSPDCHYDLGDWGQGGVRSHTFAKIGTCTQLCKLHPEMLAYVFVGQNPYAAVVDKQGHYTISGVPPGTYELEVWNSNLKAPPQRIQVTATAAAHADFAVHR